MRQNLFQYSFYGILSRYFLSSIDFESVINIEERTSYFNDSVRDEIPKICIIGCINLKNNIFKDLKKLLNQKFKKKLNEN